MNLGSMLYLPGAHVHPDRTRACLRNLGRYRHEHPIILYSESKLDWLKPELARLSQRGAVEFFPCPDPEILKRPAGPTPKLAAPKAEVVLAEWMIPKLSYLYGLEIVKQRRLDYFLTYETDCRVGCDGWDRMLFDEFFFDGGLPEPIAGGTMFAWSPFNRDRDFAVACGRFIARAHALGRTGANEQALPGVMVYGGKGSCQPTNPCVYPNGALSIIKTEVADEIFGRSANLEEKAMVGTAWDAAIGYGLVERYGNAVFDHLVPMTRSLSLYGDLLTDEPFRLGLLKTGQCVAVHWVKGVFEGW